jgi:lysophospholipase L1-like esterase
MKCVYSYNQYDLVHFNNGLHGIHVSQKNYQKSLEKVLKIFGKTKVVMALTTHLCYKGKDDFEKKRIQRVKERNEIMIEISKKYGLTVDDLYTVSNELDEKYLYGDGVHFSNDGYELLSDTVENSIKTSLALYYK